MKWMMRNPPVMISQRDLLNDVIIGLAQIFDIDLGEGNLLAKDSGCIGCAF